MAISDIYMLRFKQTWGTGGKPLENVFFYEHTAGDGVATQLAQLFEDTVMPLINDLQFNGVKNVEATVINLGVPADFVNWPLSGQGDTEDDSLPPHSALNFTMKLNTRAVRKGSKRISGIPETMQVNGIILNSGYLAKMEAFRIQLPLELESAEDTFLPVVVKRVKEEIVGTVPLQYTYRLPTTDAELTVGQILTATTTPKVSHQVSRSL